MKTVLIHNGTNEIAIEKIRELLSENNYITNEIKNRILCLDLPNKIYKVQEFLGFEEFTFLALDPTAPLDINEHIDQIIIAEDL